MTDARRPLLAIDHLSVQYGSETILDDVSLAIAEGQTVGLVGESGSGKSTLGAAIVGAVTSVAGTITVDGRVVGPASRRERYSMHRTVQLIPQDPYASLNPRHTIGEAIAEAIDPRQANVKAHRDAIADWLETVQLPADSMHRYPHSFSGGQRQRIAIARGLAVQPKVIVADEITSALDVSVQQEILCLIEELCSKIGLTMLFISHNLAVVQQISDEVVVLRQGRIIEKGTVADVFHNPKQSYTRSLLDAVPGSSGFDLEMSRTY